MNLCPTCQSQTLPANMTADDADQYCSRCHAEGRQPLVSRMGAAQMPPATAKTPVRGTQHALCPFCGGEGNEASTADDFATASRKPEYYVMCQSCGACGPPTRVKGASWIGWNVRTPCEP